MKKNLLFNVVSGLISASMLLHGTVLPVFADNAVTYADIAKTAGNDEMKEYGTNVEEGTVNPQVKNDTVPSGTGTTYYVDADSGNDENDGTSESSAWKSVEKVNSVTYQPGDRILFKAGCTWTAPEPSGEFYDNDSDGLPESFLAPQGSGTEDAWIILGAYGEGNLPKLIGDANVNSVISLKDQEYWDISNLDVSNQPAAFNPNVTNSASNAELMGNLRAIQIYGQSHSDDGVTPGGTLNGFKLHDLYVHDVSGHVYWGGSPLDRGYYGVFGKMGNDASKRTGGIVFEVWEPTTENDLTEEEKLENSKDRPITFDNIIISNNVICNTSFGGITVKQWSGQGHDEVNLNGFHSDAVPATNELWHRRFAESSKPDGYTGEMGTAENGYTNDGFHPHTNVYVTNNYVSNNKTEYGCNTIRLQSVQGGLVEHNVCSGAGTCAIELDYLDDVVVQYNEVYGTRKKMGGADNNAIDTDAETTNCLIQYNHVYNNGDGFLLCGIGFSTAVYRYNIIRDSGADDHYIGLYGDKGWNYIHNNLIYSTNNAKSFIGRPGDKKVDVSSNPIYYYNNIFCNASSGSTSPALYQGTYSYYSNNSYYGTGVIPPSSDENAVKENPNFSGDFTDDIKAFEITAYSPLIDSGKTVEYPDSFGGTFVNRYLNNLDFYGNDVSDTPDIGVSEYKFTDGKGIIRGYVTDEYGNPASGATVSFGEAQTVTTNENGYYSTGELTVGEYTLTVSKENYDDSEPVTSSVTAKAVTNTDLSLGESQSDTGLVSGVITSGGEPVAGAKVTLTVGENTLETTTDNSGTYTIEAPAGENYTIVVTKNGYKYKSQNDITVQKGNITALDLVLQSNDYSNTVYFINDSFNDYETGSFSSNDIWTAYGDSNGAVEIVEDSSGNKYLHISKTNKSSSDIGVYNTEAANLSGTVTVEAKIMRTTHGSGSYNQFGMYTFNSADWKGSGSSANPIATFFMLDKNISTHYKNESGGNSVYNLLTYDFNEWHTVRCVANLETKTYDFYVDDMTTPILSNYKLRNASKSVIDRFLLYSNGVNTGDICIDYFRVCTGSAYDYNDAALSAVSVNGIQAEKVSDTEYSVTVSSDTEKAQILPESQSAFASVKIGDTTVSDEPVEVTLNEGNNEITITVIAEDGTEKEYSVNIHRTTAAEELDASLDGVTVNGIQAEKTSDTEFSVSVPSDTKTLTVIPTAHEVYYATVLVNDEALDDNGAIVLNMDGDEIEVKITVTCRGITNNYTLTITPSAESGETPTPSPSAEPSESPTPPAEENEYIDVLDEFKDKLTIEKADNKNGTVTLTITPAENNSLPVLKLYTAVYSSDGTLKSVNITNCEIADGKGILLVTKPQINDTEQYKLMLWTDKQAPLIQAINDKTIGFFE